MSQRRKLRGGRLHQEIIDRIECYVLHQKWSNAVEIHEQLKEDLRDDPLGDKLPNDPRSIRAWVRKFEQPDPSGAWTLAEPAVDTDPGPVISVLAAMVNDPNQRAKTVTNAEAQVISRLYQAHGDIPPLEALYLARRYIARKDRGPTDGLDRYVALRGWTLPGQQYEDLRTAGLFEGVNKINVAASVRATATAVADGDVIRPGEPASAGLSFEGELRHQVTRAVEKGTKR